MTARRKHFVTFLSPGTFVSETSTRAISQWDPKKAAKMAKTIVERHGAIPYGFRFETQLTHPPVDDGEGGKLQVQPRTIETSGVFFIEGKIVTYDEVIKRDSKDESILRSNMRCNGWPLIVEVSRGYRTIMPFEPEDKIVDVNGNVLEVPAELERYRRRTIREWAKAS